MKFTEQVFYGELEEYEGKLVGVGDYYYILVTNLDTGKVTRFGDYYHEKGEIRAEGFYDGLVESGVEFSWERLPDAIAEGY